MALWKVSVKSKTILKGQRLEKGMSVEIPALSKPMGTPKYNEQIAQAFNNKYAIQLPSSAITGSYFECENIS